mmetsp:Transcript_28972/g.67743  ORF Transcript_28972/g.67743 Transcript_28972/m.67743 type:complete len:101 (+) Transcript_28972:1155-1457(+)
MLKRFANGITVEFHFTKKQCLAQLSISLCQIPPMMIWSLGCAGHHKIWNPTHSLFSSKLHARFHPITRVQDLEAISYVKRFYENLKKRPDNRLDFLCLAD